MNLDEAISLIQDQFVFTLPHPTVVVQMVGYTKRSFNLSKLPKTPLCVWCHANPRPSYRHRYCSENCAQSAYIFCHPQSPTAKAYTLIHLQKGFCTYCGTSHEDYLIKKITNRKRRKLRITYHLIAYGTGDLFHVDHIQPIHQGGRSIGLANIQVICAPCHKKKTAEERRIIPHD